MMSPGGRICLPRKLAGSSDDAVQTAVDYLFLAERRLTR